MNGTSKHLTLTSENTIRFSWNFYFQGNKIAKNYEALRYDGGDANFHFAWVRDLVTGSRKYVAVPKRVKVQLKEQSFNAQTGKKEYKYAWEPKREPEWITRLMQRTAKKVSL
jgi:hypothetical protein